MWAKQCNSETGYLYQYEVYTRKQESGTEFELGEKVVINLSSALQGKSIHVMFENFFTSLKLLEKKYEKNILQLELFALTESKHQLKWMVKDHIGYVQWQDTRLVPVISTVFHPKEFTTAKRTERERM